MVSLGIVIVIAVIAVLLGAVGGFFLARKYMQDYLKKNDATNEKPKIGFLAQKAG